MKNAIHPVLYPAKTRLLRHQFASWLALLAIVAQLLLPFAHAAAMDDGVQLAWCGTGKAPLLADELPVPAENGDAKIIVKCAICSLSSLQLLALPLAPISVPLLTLIQHASSAWRLAYIFPPSFAIAPPPRGPPPIS